MGRYDKIQKKLWTLYQNEKACGALSKLHYEILKGNFDVGNCQTRANMISKRLTAIHKLDPKYSYVCVVVHNPGLENWAYISNYALRKREALHLWHNEYCYVANIAHRADHI